AQFLGKLALRRGPGFLALIDQALRDRPGCGVLLRPERPAGMHQQILRPHRPAAVGQDPCTHLPRHALLLRGNPIDPAAPRQADYPAKLADLARFSPAAGKWNDSCWFSPASLRASQGEPPRRPGLEKEYAEARSGVVMRRGGDGGGLRGPSRSCARPRHLGRLLRQRERTERPLLPAGLPIALAAGPRTRRLRLQPQLRLRHLARAVQHHRAWRWGLVAGADLERRDG